MPGGTSSTKPSFANARLTSCVEWSFDPWSQPARTTSVALIAAHLRNLAVAAVLPECADSERSATLTLLVLAQCGSDTHAVSSSEVERPASPRDVPLTRAAGRGDLAELERLLDEGVDVDSTGETGRTAVTAAVYGGHLDAVRLLIDEGADVDSQDEHRTNPLLALGETGDVAILREVLRAEPDLTRTNRFGGTALIPASDRGHVEVVRELVRTDIDIDHVNDLGWTALLEAVILGDGGPAHQEIVRTLVAAGAAVDLADRDGVTPLDHARSRQFAEIARTLEDAGAG
jgi:uncharacterized protein